MSAYGTVTRSAPAGRRPPKPSLQIHLFMNPPSLSLTRALFFSSITVEGSERAETG